MFGGKTIVDENMLESIKDKSQYKTDGEIHQEERDVLKALKGKNVHIAFIGFEQAQANGNEGGLKNMCEVLDRAEARGEARGELKGAVRAYLDVKVPIEEIAEKLNISVEEVRKIADTL